MSEIARLYARQAARAKALGASAVPEDLFIHFGHWEDPARADTSEAGFRAAQRALDDHLLGLAELRDGQRVLDVGCGVGGTLASLNERLRGAELHGVNLDPAQIEAARACVLPRHGNTVGFVCADAVALPFAASRFERLLAVECVAHFASRARFLAEAARVLSEGGRLVLSDFVAAPELRAARDAGRLPADFAGVIARGLGPWDDFFGDGATVQGQAESAGFALVAQRSATRETAPTYGCILRAEPEVVLGDAGAEAQARGVAALAWAQGRGLLQMEYFAFERRGRVARGGGA